MRSDILSEIAHIREIDGEKQTVKEHLIEVRNLAERFGEKLGVPHLAGLAGLLHDFGKYSDDFQLYIEEAIANPENPPKRGSVDHSTAGGKLLYEFFHQNGRTQYERLLAEIIGNVIISHHAYLQDYLDADLGSKYLYRVKDKQIQQYEEMKEVFFEKVMDKNAFKKYVEKATKELETFLLNPTKNPFESMMFLTKFIFSILIDADRTDAMLFDENKSYTPLEDQTTLFSQYYDRLMEQLKIYEESADETNKIHVLRSEMSEQCENFAENAPGVYTLSIPTGGGKTLASLRYALKHALKYKKKRIIYIVPYTTIIEQNAADVRRVLGDTNNILEFHSNVVETEDEDTDDDFFREAYKVKLSKDSWDSPIIFTTMVQFLNVFYETGTRSIRRLHNLANAVIIFDEVQKVPTSCISLFNMAVNYLKNYCDTTSLLCTATQPALGYVEKSLEVNIDGEIVQDLPNVIDAFKRVELIDDATDTLFTTEKLSIFIQEKILENDSILVILNTKTVVRKLYEKLTEELDDDLHVYHLSTSMCPAHRKILIEEMKWKLNNNEKVVCVSTQLIEAGVDISFKSVIRSLAGLDSIAQAAGRCNRHGESGAFGKVHIIDHQEESLKMLKEINMGKIIAKRLLIDIKRSNRPVNDILSNEVMERYFQEFYSEFRDELDYPVRGYRENMVQMLTDDRQKSERYRHYFKQAKAHLPLFNINCMHTAAKHFHVIENQTTTVIVPYEEGKEIITELISAETITDLNVFLKKAQQYTVNLYDQEKRKIEEKGGMYGILDQSVFILTEGFYDERYGISHEGEGGLSSLMM